MTRPLVLIECVPRRQLPALPWALLAAGLGESVPHDRLQVHEYALSSLAKERSIRGLRGGSPPALVYLDTRFPVGEAMDFVLAIAPVPVVLYGPHALDRFERVPARGAIVGPAREELRALGNDACRASDPLPVGRYQAVDRFLVRDGVGLEECWHATSAGPWPTAEAILRPFVPSFDWDYHGPRRREDPAMSHRAAPWWPEPVTDAPSILERDAARIPLPSADGELPPRRFDRRWTKPSLPVLAELLERDPEAELFGFQGGPRSESITLLVEETRVLSRLGHRSLVVQAQDPGPLLLPWLRELSRTDLRPQEVVLSPSIRVLRRSEGIRQEILGAAQLSERLTLQGIEFANFDDRSLRLQGLGETHWDQRWVARLLCELDGSFDGRIAATTGHRLSLFDPWLGPRELLESLVAVEEDAPFLKAQVHSDASLRIPSRHGSLGRRIEEAGLLSAGRAGSGWEFRFEDPRMQSFHELSQQGLGPLVESVGRLRLSPEARQLAIVEARFRWFRQLAEAFETDPDGSGASWGKVLAAVTRQVAVDMRRG